MDTDKERIDELEDLKKKKNPECNVESYIYEKLQETQRLDDHFRAM